MRPILEIASTLGIPRHHLTLYGEDKAKVEDAIGRRRAHRVSAAFSPASPPPSRATSMKCASAACASRPCSTIAAGASK